MTKQKYKKLQKKTSNSLKLSGGVTIKMKPKEQHASLSNVVSELKPILKILQITIPYTIKRSVIPSNPNSSPITEKIKSE